MYITTYISHIFVIITAFLKDLNMLHNVQFVRYLPVFFNCALFIRHAQSRM